MNNFVIRTEELEDSQLKELYVETENDNDILNRLKSQSPVLLVGSRGMGKSFLFKISQMQLLENFQKDRIFPVFLTFRSASLVQTGNNIQFELWMLNKICTVIIRELKRQGLITGNKWNFGNIVGDECKNGNSIEILMEINKQFENSWKNPGKMIDVSAVPTIDDLMEIIEDLCWDLNIKRFVIYIDEAAHIFIPEQQRQFFSIFREIRSAYVKCNAAVYPGVTCYGDTFEPMHDAVTINLTRDIREENYIDNMKEMVLKQVEDSEMVKNMLQNGENFSVLAYAACGNPRLLLRSVEKAGNFKSNSVTNVFREFYREEIWSEQSSLAEKYPGNSEFVDWGRNFIESVVLPEIKSKNDKFLPLNKSTSAFFWIHRNSPQVVKESLRILEYTGIIKLQATGIKATNSEIGNRYEVNIGCLLALETLPLTNALNIIKKLSAKKMSEFGANSKAYDSLLKKVPQFTEPNMTECLKMQLTKSINVLEITEWQKGKLRELNINNLGELLISKESDLMKAYQVGKVRSRQMKNAAFAAVFEYLFG